MGRGKGSEFAELRKGQFHHHLERGGQGIQTRLTCLTVVEVRSVELNPQLLQDFSPFSEELVISSEYKGMERGANLGD